MHDGVKKKRKEKRKRSHREKTERGGGREGKIGSPSLQMPNVKLYGLAGLGGCWIATGGRRREVSFPLQED
jgi:hypothetical protein